MRPTRLIATGRSGGTTGVKNAGLRQPETVTGEHHTQRTNAPRRQPATGPA